VTTRPVSRPAPRDREAAGSPAGDFDALVAVLDPDVVFRLDTAAARREFHGAEEVSRTALTRGARFAPFAKPAIVNGAASLVLEGPGRLRTVIGFTVANGLIASIDLVSDLGPGS
jgi:hypothetical protein